MSAGEKPAVRKLFAEFAVRMVGLWIDMLVVVFIGQVLVDHVLWRVGVNVEEFGTLLPFLMFVYFTAAWASPLRATPAQLLFGMRIVDKRGETLGLWRAAVRAAALMGLFFACFSLFGIPGNRWLLAVSLGGYAAVFSAAVTPNRQALHDILVGSIVVNRRTLTDAEKKQELLEHLAQGDPPMRWRSITGAIAIGRDAVALAIPVALMTMAGQMHVDRDMNYRTGYALRATETAKIVLTEAFHHYGYWPTDEAVLGAPVRGDYPDGGYWQIEDNGVIRIRFEVMPQLVKGSIVVEPTVGDDGIAWRCYGDGDISQRHLPSDCRIRD